MYLLLTSAYYTRTLTQSEFRMRVLDNVMFAGAFLVVALVGWWLLRDRNVGHRTLIKIGTGFFFMGFLRYTYSSWALLTGHYEISTLLITLCMVTGWVLAGYLFSSRMDIKKTLAISEHHDREFKDSIADLRTITSGMVIRAETTEQKAVAVSREYARRAV